MENYQELRWMILLRRVCGCAVSALLVSAAFSFFYQSAAAEVSQEVLDAISTPDQVETPIGTLEFFDGIPATSMEALRHGHESLGAGSSNQALIFDALMDSNPLWSRATPTPSTAAYFSIS